MGKKYFYIVLFIFTSYYSFAQVKIITRTDSLFFVGIDNEVIVKPGKIPFEKIRIQINGGFISGIHGNYIVRCTSPGTQVSIKVLYKQKIVAAKKMQVVRVSDPEIFVAGDSVVKGGFISKKYLSTFKSLIVEINVPYLQMTVTKFDYKRISNNNAIDSIKNFGNVFSSQLRELLQNAMKGDTLVFENAYVTGPDDNNIFYQSIKLTVTD